MVRIQDLSCGYGKEVVLKGINLEIGAGDFVGLIGPNGSGKTTLTRAASGILPPMQGKIFLDGRPMGRMCRKELARKVAVVTQSQEAVPPFTVEQFVLLARIPHWARFQLLETNKDLEAAGKAMALTGTSHLKEKKMGELSGGEVQLVCLARALAQEPDLLLLDEPTAHLDIGHQVQIMGLLDKLNSEGLTIMAVLHDLNLAGIYCQRLALLEDGRLRKVGRPKEVLTEEIINEVYNTSITVREEPSTSHLFVLPAHRA